VSFTPFDDSQMFFRRRWQVSRLFERLFQKLVLVLTRPYDAPPFDDSRHSSREGKMVCCLSLLPHGEWIFGFRVLLNKIELAKYFPTLE
jgi:hypothetical protein